MSRSEGSAAVSARALALVVLTGLATSCAAPPAPSRSGERAPAIALVHRPADAILQEFPWGEIRWRLNSELDPAAEMTLGVVRLDANRPNPLHLHASCAEYLYVLSGSCEHRLGDRWVSLKAGDLVRIPAGVEHMARTGDEPMRALIVYSSGTRDFKAVGEGESE